MSIHQNEIDSPEHNKTFRALLNQDEPTSGVNLAESTTSNQRQISITSKHIASLSTCGLGLLAIWTNNKLIKLGFSSLLLYKAYKLYTIDESVKKFIDDML